MSQGIHKSGSNLSTMDIKGFMLAVVFFLAKLSSVACSCPSLLEVMGMTEQCMSELENYKRLSLTGGITHRKKTNMCNTYDEAVACMSRLVDSCQEDNPSEVHHTALMLDDLKEGFGRLCTDQGYFNEYMTYVSCFKETSEETGSCLDTFHHVTMSEEQDMCLAIEDLEACTRGPIEALCGRQGADVFMDICRHQIPQGLSAHCGKTSTTEAVVSPPCRCSGTGGLMQRQQTIIPTYAAVILCASLLSTLMKYGRNEI